MIDNKLKKNVVTDDGEDDEITLEKSNVSVKKEEHEIKAEDIKETDNQEIQYVSPRLNQPEETELEEEYELEM